MQKLHYKNEIIPCLRLDKYYLIESLYLLQLTKNLMHKGGVIFGLFLFILSVFFTFTPIFAAPFIGSFSIFQGMTLAPDSGYEDFFYLLAFIGFVGFVIFLAGCFTKHD